MEATKIKGIINEQGQLIIEDKINFSAGEVEVIILQSNHINKEENKVNKPIWQIAEELIENVSEAEKLELPKDGSVEHDHYIYGTPKINQ